MKRALKVPAPGRGYYNATRGDWLAAWRCARIMRRHGLEPDIKLRGVWYKAQLIARFDRSAHLDWLTCPVKNRLISKQLIAEIIAEEKLKP